MVQIGKTFLFRWFAAYFCDSNHDEVYPSHVNFKAKNTVETTAATQGSFKDLFNSHNVARTCLISVSYFFTLMVVYIMLSWLPSLFMELGFTRKEGSTAQFFSLC